MGTKEKMLRLLQDQDGAYISGDCAARSIGVSRSAVWKAVETLRREGYVIDAVTNRGYCLRRSDILNDGEVAAALRGDINLLKVFSEIDSTNTYLKRLCVTDGAEDKSAVVAASQSGGRGRLGRSFCSPAHSGVYLSVAYKPTFDTDTALLITAAAAVAVCQVLDLYCVDKAQIKWVNDVYLGGKKVCGILTEAVSDIESGRLEYIIIGIGINIRGLDAYPDALKPILTTMEAHTASVLPTRAKLAAQIINALCGVVEHLQDEDIMREYRARSCVLGKEVNVIKNDTERAATVLDIDSRGALCVQFENGETARLNSAEISIRQKEM